MPRNMTFAIRGEYITLDALLKAVGAADSGAQAKHRIAEGEVTVDGEVETRKTRKLRGGETVVVDDLTVVLAAENPA
jgi:ribosome-associated protein